MTFNPAEPRDSRGRWARLSGLLKSAGGFTHSIHTGLERSSGFAVARPGAEEVFDGHASSEQIAGYVKRHYPELAADSKAHFGGWYNAEDGKTYLDISLVHDNFNEALAAAREGKQIALYDLNSGVEFHTFQGDWQQSLDAMKGKDLKGLPSKATPVPGHGTYTFHSNRELQGVANAYMKQHGLGKHPTDYSTVDPAKAAKVAEAFAAMKHDPEDPKVKAAYAALKSETMDQYEALTKSGFEFHFYPEGGDPYANSPREAIYDLTHNHKMFVYPTLGAGGGFGDTPGQFQNHPLLEKVPGLQWDGHDVTYNDVFRAVHDAFGHGKEGVGFRAQGEDNAYRQHFAMFSPMAQKAIASETRGQNTWLNFGPHGEANRHADTAHTVFADQKAGLLPDWAIDPEYLKKTEMNMSRSIQTPGVKSRNMDLSQKRDGSLAFWKQILPMKKVDYTAQDGSRQSVIFDKEYLTDLANNMAVDKIGFLLADENNRHTMDPERYRGHVAKMEVREDGLYGKIVFPSAEAAKAVLDNPELGVSARIRENVQRSDGRTLNRGIIHVLGTLDPQVSGMAPWQPTDLSATDEVLDLSTEEFKDMAKKPEKKALSDYTEADIEKMTEEELDAFLAEHVPGFTHYDGEKPDEGEKPETEETTDEEVEDKTLVGAGADMSNKTKADIDLATQRAESAERRAAEAMRRVAEAEWREERNAYIGAGVPPHALDLAAPVLNRADDMVIDLSNTEESDVNVSEVVRGLLDTLKGTVDLSNEAGHVGTFSASDGEDPDKDMLDRWNAQF